MTQQKSISTRRSTITDKACNAYVQHSTFFK